MDFRRGLINPAILYDVGENTQHRRCNRLCLAVIPNVSSGAPEKNVNDLWDYDLVTFLEVAKSNGQRLATCRLFTNF